ncbi:MAG TPA: peptidylprolyl isomerase [Acidimicrobiales bacterium]|nr:peptidylprolyl isomerase [Acidimicrobiales bacterium]
MPSEKRARQKAARRAKLAAQARARRRRRLLRSGTIVAVVAAFVIGTVYLLTRGSSGNPSSPASRQAAADRIAVAAGCPASTKARVNTQHYAAAPPMTIDRAASYSATVRTTAGTFVIALDAASAPVTVNNFVFLADHGFYRCVIFHRVIPGFVDQTGDPTGTGTGGPGYTIPDELPPKVTAGPQYPRGSVAMANTGTPNSGGSQWFVVVGRSVQLADQYTLFGHVTSGMKVVDAINRDGSASGVPPRVTQRILSVTIHKS